MFKIKHVALALGLMLLLLPTEHAQETGNANTPAPALVLGAVHKPGRFELRRNVRLSEILKLVGGVTKGASEKVEITHTEKTSTRDSVGEINVYLRKNLKTNDAVSNPIIEAGDIVIVVERDPIYVAGLVVNEGGFYYEPGLTLTRALKLAGGEKSPEKIRAIIIHRWNRAAPSTLIEIDPKELKNHRVKDLVLKPYDIVEVRGDEEVLLPPGCILRIGLDLGEVRIIR